MDTPDGLITIDEIIRHSHERAVLIFKHSPRCGVSSMVHWRLQQSELFNTLPLRLVKIDVIHSRDLSSEIARYFGVIHESPQALLVIDGICTYHRSHMQIRVSEIAENLKVKNN